MSLHEVLSSYTTAAATKVCALALLVFALQAAVLPFVLITLLLHRAQQRLATAATAVPTTVSRRESAKRGEPA